MKMKNNLKKKKKKKFDEARKKFGKTKNFFNHFKDCKVVSI